MKKFNFVLASVVMLFASCGNRQIYNYAHSPKMDNYPITVYYDNDVHCAVDGYDEISALKLATPNCCIVSAGDYVQGGSLGAASKGGYIVELMNAAAYDVVTLGNHEFDYGMNRLAQFTDSLQAEITVCNLLDLRTGKRLFKPYVMKNFGSVDVAFVGIATPYSFISSTPSYFQDENGNYVYSLCSDNFYEYVQSVVDSARKNGAEYVVGLTHLGDDPLDKINSPALISSTTGFDAVIDGHSHSTIPSKFLTDKSGAQVLLTSTGDYFNNIGKLTIYPGGRIRSELIPLASCTLSDEKVVALANDIKARYEATGSRVVGRSEAMLTDADESNPRIVRCRETGLGNFCADAIRAYTGTEIAVLAGGGVRAALPQGDITFNDIFTLFPFGGTIAKAKISGRQIVDMLEFSAIILPDNFGGFLQVSGLRFDVDESIPSPVIVNDAKLFAGFKEGRKRRVSNVCVLDGGGKYVPIDMERIYTVSGTTYTLKEQGDGYSVLNGIEVLDTGILDLQTIETYIVRDLNGVIPASYAQPEGRIRKITK